MLYNHHVFPFILLLLLLLYNHHLIPVILLLLLLLLAVSMLWQRWRRLQQVRGPVLMMRGQVRGPVLRVLMMMSGRRDGVTLHRHGCGGSSSSSSSRCGAHGAWLVQVRLLLW